MTTGRARLPQHQPRFCGDIVHADSETALVLAAVTAIFGTLWALVRPRASLVLENLALRQQIAVLRRRSRLGRGYDRLDRAFWAVLSQAWSRWAEALLIIKPATVVSWHRRGFARFWAHRSRRIGRPPLDARTVALIERMSSENPLWSRRRIASELAKLGHPVNKDTVARYMLKAPTRRPLQPPSNDVAGIRPRPPGGHDRHRLPGRPDGDLQVAVRLLRALAQAAEAPARERVTRFTPHCRPGLPTKSWRPLATTPDIAQPDQEIGTESTAARSIRCAWTISASGKSRPRPGLLGRTDTPNGSSVRSGGRCSITSSYSARVISCAWFASTPPTTTTTAPIWRSTETRPSPGRSSRQVWAASSRFRGSLASTIDTPGQLEPSDGFFATTAAAGWCSSPVTAPSGPQYSASPRRRSSAAFTIDTVFERQTRPHRGGDTPPLESPTEFFLPATSPRHPRVRVFPPDN